jgi:hypothetical protein
VVPYLTSQEQRIRAYLDERCRLEGRCWNYERIVRALGWRYAEFEGRSARGEHLASRPPAMLAAIIAPTDVALAQRIAMVRSRRAENLAKD